MISVSITSQRAIVTIRPLISSSLGKLAHSFIAKAGNKLDFNFEYLISNL